MKSAVVAIAGRPSAGKSTFLNSVCGGKVSITSPVPQTTRNRIRGILTRDAGQLVFLDTPGFHLSERKLNLKLRELMLSSLSEVDAVLYIIDATRDLGGEETELIDVLRQTGKPTAVLFNKMDRVSTVPEALRNAVATALPAAPVFQGIASTGAGLDEVLKALFKLSPEGEPLYPNDYYTDQTPEFRISEIVREKAIHETREEIPHALYVHIEDLEYREDRELLWARVILFVERESQKGILVGRGGEKIRRIRLLAEAELSELFPYKVALDLRVKVDERWRRRDALLSRLIT